MSRVWLWWRCKKSCILLLQALLPACMLLLLPWKCFNIHIGRLKWNNRWWDACRCTTGRNKLSLLVISSECAGGFKRVQLNHGAYWGFLDSITNAEKRQQVDSKTEDMFGYLRLLLCSFFFFKWEELAGFSYLFSNVLTWCKNFQEIPENCKQQQPFTVSVVYQ